MSFDMYVCISVGCEPGGGVADHRNRCVQPYSTSEKGLWSCPCNTPRSVWEYGWRSVPSSGPDIATIVSLGFKFAFP